ncbi:M15 family metallopeptidase [Anaerosacchariphilus sp. NSJ-68]|uniref:M15 family metallopeptidase n=2 Tax=Lachnospiraceae TaxID=186803 RepID=A0A923LCJ1_9FIRM|nr:MULTISPECIES: M15 family metallopeptidase [Lachnospiraceae]MBC5660048.1 M15 family metallopeptidase [Anaerosacchariphilus hominis]MBC5699163.1 M15 family metallopeptidase [Roseburia difficilis]
MTRRQKRRTLLYVGSLSVVLCAGMVIGTAYAQNAERSAREEREAQKLALEAAEGTEDTTAEDTDAEDTEEETEPEDAEEHLPEDWNLILVNKTHPIPDDYEVELKSIGSGHQIDARAYDDFRAMIQASKADGVYIYVTSSYRDRDKQISLYQKKTDSYLRQGYSLEDAKEKAGQVVAVPGTSEHHLGLALDMVSSEYRKLDEKQENTRGFQWLKAHSWEYGFILRYPNGSTDITGIIYEPWHFRYVGKEAAKEIYEQGVTLEEYLGAKPVSEGEAVTYDYVPRPKKKAVAPAQENAVNPEEQTAAPGQESAPNQEEQQAAESNI